MPINPEYIPLPKSKEMFAIASWRDSPGLNATPAAHPGVSGSPHLASLDALRNGKGMAGMHAAATTTTTTTNTVTAAGGSLLPPAVQPAEDSKDAAKSKAPLTVAAGKKKKRKPASGATTSTASVAGSGVRSDDVDDFFVHILLPSCVSMQTLEFELQAQTTPLKSIEVGLPKVLFPRKPVGGAGGDASPPTTTALAPAVASAKIVSSPSCAPAVNPTNNELSLPLMRLPPADLPEPAPSESSCAAPPSASAAAAAHVNGDGTASAAAASGEHHGGEYQVSLLFAEKAEAEKTVTFVQRRWPTAAVSLASRSRSVLNATLVLKGMPNQAKTETVLTEMQNLPHTPSYVRLLRSERGVFKGVVFVKYANCEIAEECKLRLEKFVLGSRPLKVEFKKKSTAAASVSAAVIESKRSLQELVRELRVSAEHEGFHLSRSDVAKEALKVLKQLCQSYGLLFDMNDQQVTVRRVLGSNGIGSEKPSPALRPQSMAPAWAPATPAPLRPMDFKGISHWKDIRSQASTLGIMRPLGPEDGKPAFSAGRGRPL
ncbi:conserved hypothetical protein [Leishmania major strain Friedlin]|uniref:RRM domain-containing protein n=1 Tax=Leishmania major TaxID=5664 RepID=Q4QAL0_LEIMA|nr:conserved hypothetical protein [Leishmania major strain Friedlin]CAG9574592.1 RNA-binding_protein_38_-_putative [Leishmania major strain Friedlin]CAJ04886.1 conserved hypothetical protein [Leishmania major strain Friedlin]|eukprot:XP_001683638.1 conserved hypothetical protein [Leishmania major strain Friedlin]